MLLIYILIVGLIDMFVFLSVNKIVALNKRVSSAFAIFIGLLILVHLNFFHWGFLLSLQKLLMCLFPLIGCLIIGYFGMLSTKRANNSSFLNKEQKVITQKIYSIVFFKILYVLTFIAQVIFLINYIKE